MAGVSIWYMIAIVINCLSAIALGMLLVERYVFKLDTIQAEETFESEEEKQSVISDENRRDLIGCLVIVVVSELIAAYAGLGSFANGLMAVLMLDVFYVICSALLAYVVMKAKKTSLAALVRGALSFRRGRG